MKEYHHISVQLEENYSDQILSQLEQVQAKLEHADGWRFENKINEVLLKLGLNQTQNYPHFRAVGSKRH